MKQQFHDILIVRQSTAMAETSALAICESQVSIYIADMWNQVAYTAQL